MSGFSVDMNIENPEEMELETLRHQVEDLRSQLEDCLERERKRAGSTTGKLRGNYSSSSDSDDGETLKQWLDHQDHLESLKKALSVGFPSDTKKKGIGGKRKKSKRKKKRRRRRTKKKRRKRR